jgi:hypothetical protein
VSPDPKEDTMPRSTDSAHRDPLQPRLYTDDPYWASCPIASSWKTWDFLNIPERRLKDEALTRDDELRQLVCITDLGELRLHWSIAADDPIRTHVNDGTPMGKHPHSSHVHSEIQIDGVSIHIDWVTANRYGPGRSMTEAHIFVGGALAGHAWQGGCSLGFGGSRFPAVALVRAGRALVVDGNSEPLILYEAPGYRYLRADADVQRPRVWLWEVGDLEASQKAKGSVRRLGDRPR